MSSSTAGANVVQRRLDQYDCGTLKLSATSLSNGPTVSHRPSTADAFTR